MTDSEIRDLLLTLQRDTLATREAAESTRSSVVQVEAIFRARLSDHERRIAALEKRNGRAAKRG